MRTIDFVDLAQLGGGSTTINVGYADDTRLALDPPLYEGEAIRFVEAHNLHVVGTVHLIREQGHEYWQADVDRATITAVE